MAEERFTRRRLPHWYVPCAVHFVTYRLAGTIPVAVLERLRAERDGRLRATPADGTTEQQGREEAHLAFFAGYDGYLDSNSHLQWLAEPQVAAMVRGNLYHYHGRDYHLVAYCIMPNHVHVLLQPTADLEVADDASGPADERPDVASPLAAIMHGLKSYTAHEANRLLERSGQFWQHESYDHWVRDGDELARLVDYVAWNPVKAGLAREPHDWCWGSAHDRFLLDGSDLALVADPVGPMP